MQLIHFLFDLYKFIIIVKVVTSWIHIDPYHPIVIWVDRLTEPVLEPIRRMIPFERIGLDLSPLVALFGLQILERLIMYIIFSF
jgi:YggT family protein